MWFLKRKTQSPRSILFVCTANITRSPVAELMFRYLVEEAGEIWEIDSAGTNSVRGVSPNQIISFIMFQRKMPIQNHRSQPVTRKLLEKFYWIIVMEENHRQEILKIDETTADRVFLFRELSSNKPLENLDMPDPTGKEVDDYQELFDILDDEMPRLFSIMRDKAYEVELEDDNDPE